MTDKYHIGVRQGKDIGTERKSAGLYDIVLKVDGKWTVVGELEWLYSGRWKCAAGTFKTRGAALEAVKGLLA